MIPDSFVYGVHLLYLSVFRMVMDLLEPFIVIAGLLCSYGHKPHGTSQLHTLVQSLSDLHSLKPAAPTPWYVTYTYMHCTEKICSKQLHCAVLQKSHSFSYKAHIQ